MFKMNSSKLKNTFFKYILFLTAISAILTIFFIIFFLVKEAFPMLHQIWTFLSHTEWNPTVSEYGALPLIVGTLVVTLGAMLIAIPLGIGCAIYISEIAHPKIKPFIKSCVEVLAGIPSVVYGFFGLMILTDWLRITFDKPSGECWLAGSILLGIMALPTIVSVSEDAISSVPKEYKEGSLAMGATRWQTMSKVILPSALSGITAAIILGMGRAIGETMAVMMVTGNAAIFPESVFSPVRTLTATLGIETAETPVGSSHYHALFGLALILFIIVLITNMVAHTIHRKLKERRIPKRKMFLKDTKKLKPYIYLILCTTAIGLVTLWFGVVISGILVLLIVCVYFISIKISVKTTQKIAFGLSTLSVIIVFFMLSIILFYIIVNGMGALNWEFLSGSPRDCGRAGGIYPAIVGTLYLVAGAIIIALPLGVGAGIYLAEYTKETALTRIIRISIDNLNAVPSIVFGLFGFAFFVLYLNFGVSLLAGQIILALMILPTIIRTTEEALKSVPQSVREGSLALGATKLQTIRKVVLPSAAPGILTGTILGIGRAAGETAPIMFTAVVFSQQHPPITPMEPVMALSNHLFVLSTNVPGSEQNAYGTALVLLMLVLSLYLIAIVIRNYYKKIIRW